MDLEGGRREEGRGGERGGRWLRARPPGKQSESWPVLAGGAPQCSRAAGDGVPGTGPSLMVGGEANKPPNAAPQLTCTSLSGK